MPPIQILTTQSDQAGYEVDVRLQDGTTIQVNPLPASAVIPGGLPTGEGAAVSYVWRPGGVAAQGVFTTWATLAAAFATTDPAQLKVVSVDDSIAAAHITAGAWPSCDNISWRSGGNDSGGSSLATVIIDQGASFTGPVAHMHAEGIAFSYAATSGALITTAAGQSFSMILSGVLMVGTGGGGTGIVSAGAGAAISLRAYTSSLQNQLFSGAATSSFAGALFDGTSFGPNCLDMTAGAAAVILADGSCFVSTAQTPAPSVTILDPTPTFVFRPGGVAGGNVYTAFGTLYGALLQTPGPKILSFDNSLGATHLPTAGMPVAGWNLDQVTITGPETASGPQLIIDDGALIDPATRSLFFDAIFVLNHSTTNVWTPTTAFGAVCVFDHGAGGESTAAGSLLAVTAAAPFSEVIANAAASLGDGTHNLFTVAVGQTLVMDLGFVSLFAHAVGGLGTANILISAETNYVTPQDVAVVNLTMQAAAKRVAYTPGTTGNWNPVPTLTNAALDQLAASNTTQASGNTGTGTGTVTVTTGNITKQKSGKMCVRASCLLSTSASASTLTVQLKRDAANIGNAKTLVVPATGIPTGIDVNIDFVDTAPDTAAHTYTLSVSVSAGTLTAAANSAQIVVVEDT
jgi:hypothetical protein